MRLSFIDSLDITLHSKRVLVPTPADDSDLFVSDLISVGRLMVLHGLLLDHTTITYHQVV